MQTIYSPERDVVYMTLCHHPPDWLVDEDECEEALLAHSHVQLFGHKHLHKHRKINNSLVLSSGAVHPVRTEVKWEPRYYFLSLEVVSRNQEGILRVKIFPRVWDKTSREFISDTGTDPDGSVTETLSLPPWERQTLTTDIGKEVSMPPSVNRKRLIHQ